MFYGIEALNTEGELGKIIEWKHLLLPKIYDKSKGLGEAVGWQGVDSRRCSCRRFHPIPIRVQQAPPRRPAGPTPFPGGTREVRDGHGGIRHTTAVAAGTMRGVSGEARADGGEAAAAICVPVPGPSLRSAGSP